MTFQPGNTISSLGGRARAEALPPERRAEIARQGGKAGFRAFVNKYFDGDLAAAKAYIARRGAWAADRAAYAGTTLYKPFAYPHPGPLKDTEIRGRGDAEMVSVSLEDPRVPAS